MRKKSITLRNFIGFCMLAVALYPHTLLAHGFGERYDLPVPLALYLSGSALAVLLSFVVIAFFIKGAYLIKTYPKFCLISYPSASYSFVSMGFKIIRLLVVVLFIVIVIGGLYGKQNPFENIAPTAVWVIWWVGFSYIVGILGNIWLVVNPWEIVFNWIEKIWNRLFPVNNFSLMLSWPNKLGTWPAVFLFSWFIWGELIWPDSDSPRAIANMIITYSGITWLGMWVFGKDKWLEHGEVFSVLFNFLGRFSITEFHLKKELGECQVDIRPWAVGLLTHNPLSTSCCVFVLLMLASVTFDGLLATPLWASVAGGMIETESIRFLLVFLQDYTGNAVTAVATIALVVFFLIFIAVYIIFSAFMWILLPKQQRDDSTIGQLAKTFVLSLIPIALAYHLAHYISYLAIVGQYIIPLASDPLGLGWNLFGTQLYQVDISVINARLVWYTSVVAIVIGHIIAVWLAHVMAIRTFRDNRIALVSQIPMLVLMVSYTMLSLWIMAQPIVE